MDSLNLLLIQSDVVWQDKTANMAVFEEKIWGATADPDLILLPELFNTGFTMDSAGNAEMMNLTTFKWMHQISQQKQALVVGSYIVRENDKFFNRAVAMQPDGSCDIYDKRHLFRMADENQSFSPGRKRTIIDFRGWKIFPLICYDLRFPVWARNNVDAEGELEYDLLLFSANWPDPRINAWDILLKARAIENLSYCAGLNRIGKDHDGRYYSGHSQVIDFKGDILADLGDKDGIIECTLHLSQLKDYRKSFPAHLDADSFEIT